MNTQKYVIASLGAAVFLFLYGWLAYGFLLTDYMSANSPPGMFLPEGQENVLAIALGCLIQGFALGLIYVNGHEGKGAMEGVRFGIYFGLFFLGMHVLSTGVMPVSLATAFTYAATDMLMYVGAGVVLALLYKK